MFGGNARKQIIRMLLQRGSSYTVFPVQAKQQEITQVQQRQTILGNPTMPPCRCRQSPKNTTKFLDPNQE
jgi:carbamoylphosphate synthase small subunit